MSTPKLKRALAALLAVIQLAAPIAASAGQYMQLVPVRDLRVTNGAALPVTNVDATNTSTTVVPVGAAVLKASPSAIDFGAIATGSQSAIQTITLTNLGGAPAVLGTLATNVQFSVTDNCDGVTLPSLGTCQVNVTFAPTQMALSGLSGSLVVPVTAGAGTTAQAIIGMQGVATAPDPSKVQAAALQGFGAGDPAMVVNANGQPQINFAGALAGTQSFSKTFVIQSNGTVPVTFNGVQFAGNDGSYSYSTTCGATIAAGDGCAITVTFAPTTLGFKTATLNVKTSSIVGNTMAVVLAGNATAVSTFSLSSSSINFGSVSVSQTGVQSIAVLNTGNTTLTYPALTVTGSGVTASHACPAVLDVGASCLVTLNFTPAAPFNLAGQLSVIFSESSPVAAAITGEGSGPMLSVDASTHAFGNVFVGQSAAHIFTIFNDGSAPAPLTFGALPANVAKSGDCTTAIAPAGVCHLVLTFVPSDTSALSGSTTVASTLNSLTLNFSATASTAPSFSLSASALTFGDVAANATASQTLQVTNSGTVPASPPSVSISGAGYSATHNCPATLAVGATCLVTVTFAPTAAQSYSAILSVGYGNLTPQTALLSGTGQTAGLWADVPSQAFGAVNIGTSVARTFTLTNSGNLAASLSYSTVAAPVVLSGTCGATLAPGATCNVILTYTPMDTTTTTGAVTVSGANTAVSLSYSGTGAALPGFTLSTATVSLGTVAANTSASQSFQVNNSGNTPLSAPVVTSSATGLEGVTVVHNCPDTLAVGTSCLVTLTFAPTTAQSVSGAVFVAFSGLGTQGVGVSGTGASAVLAVDTATQSFGAVTVGTTLDRTFTLTNTGNVAAALSFSVVAAPVSRSGTCAASLAAGATCTVVLTYAPTDSSTTTGTVTASALNTSVALNYSGTGLVGFALSSASVDFGTVTGNASVQRTVQVNNTGSQALSTPTIAVAGTGFSASHACGATLAAGTSCPVTLTFAPTAPVAYSGTLSVTFANAGAVGATLLGQGSGPWLTANTLAQNFGPVYTGHSAALTYLLTNTGTASAPLSFGALPAGVTRSGSCATALAAGATCSLTLTYAPTVTGSLSGTAAVSSTLNSLPLTVTGTAIPPANLIPSTASLNVGSAPVGGSLQGTLRLTNNTGYAMPFTVAPAVTGAAFAATTNCGSGIEASAYCDVTLTFSPVAAGAASEALTFTTYAGMQTVSLSGSAYYTGPTVSSSALNYATPQYTGTSSSAQAVVVHNPNLVDIAVSAVTTTGPFSATTDCPATWASAADCTVNVSYVPTGMGTQTGMLSVATTAGTATVALTGSGLVAVTAAFSSSYVDIVTPVSGEFGTVALNAAATKTFYVKAYGNDRALQTTVSLTGDSAYSLVSVKKMHGYWTDPGGIPYTVMDVAGCSASVGPTSATVCYSDMPGIAPYVDMAVTVQVLATGPGPLTATISVVHNGANGSPITLALTSTVATNPSFTTSTTGLAFPVVSVGSSSSLSFSVTSTGDTALSTPAISVTGTGYTVTHNCPASLAVSASCTVTVTFTPTSTQSNNGAVSVNFAGLTAKTVALTGAGQVDYRSQLTGYNTAQIPSCKHSAWSSALGNDYYSTNSAGCSSAVGGTRSLGKIIYISGAAVPAKVQALVDDIGSNVKVNGASVAYADAGFSNVGNSASFTLYPGYNSVSIDVNNTGGPGGWHVQVVDANSGALISDATGWNYK